MDNKKYELEMRIWENEDDDLYQSPSRKCSLYKDTIEEVNNLIHKYRIKAYKRDVHKFSYNVWEMDECDKPHLVETGHAYPHGMP